MNKERVLNAIANPDNYLAAGADSTVYKIPPYYGERRYLAKLYLPRLSRNTLFSYFTATNRLAWIAEKENWTWNFGLTFDDMRIRIVPYREIIACEGYQIGIVPFINTARCSQDERLFGPRLRKLADSINARFGTTGIDLMPINVRRDDYRRTLHITDLCGRISLFKIPENSPF